MWEESELVDELRRQTESAQLRLFHQRKQIDDLIRLNAQLKAAMASCPNVHLVIRPARPELFDGEYLDARWQVPMD